MDPISVVGFVAAVIQLIEVTSKVVSYFNDVKDAPKDRAKLAREAAGLLLLFTDLRYRMEETAPTDPWSTGLRSLGGKGGPLMEYKSAMEDIAGKLAPATSGVNLRRALRWTLDKKEIDTILLRIERLKTLVGLALQKDHFKLSLAMKEEMTGGFQEMKTNHDSLSLAMKEEIKVGLQEMKTDRDKVSLVMKEAIKVGFQETKTNHDVDKINQWLAAPVPSSNHNTAIKKRQWRTGEWFTQSNEFADWKTRTSSFLWLHGIPGCGKTILCSTIIQDVISNYQSELTIAVAYFYFDFNDSDKQRTEKLIRSLIVQLSAHCMQLPDPLQSAYSRSQNGQNQPTIEDLTTLLCQLLRYFKSTYILLDALDECTDRESLLEFLEALVGWNIHGLHLLATSRKEKDITTSLEPLVTYQLCIQSALVDADIRVHVLERLSSDPKLKRWPADVQDEIENTLVKGAEGMFRWVICQLDSLRKCLKLDALRKALKTLPKTLDDTYERILSNIDQEYKEDALKVFELLCFSARPMRLDEMVEVLAIDSSSDSRFSPEQRLPDPYDILTICSTLVSVTTAIRRLTPYETIRTQELRLAHFSVKEYFISDRLKKSSMCYYHITPSSANVSIAKACLAYLLHFETLTMLTAEFDHDFPFIRYAAEFWPWHYRSITDDADREAVDFLGLKLVESGNSCFINWLRIFDPDDPDTSESELDLNILTHRISSPLYYMSQQGVSGVLKILLKKGADVNAEGRRYGNALIAASFNGHEQVVRLLLGKGANLEARNGPYRNALVAASEKGDEGVARILLEDGANVNAADRACCYALSTASFYGHEKFVGLLLEKGVNVNAECQPYGNNALSSASHRGHEGMVRLLLEKGANVNVEDREYDYALSVASYGGHEGIVRLLLEKGASGDAEGGTYGHALSAAASNKNGKGLVQWLIEKGADINAEGEKYSSALLAASYHGHEGMVRFLLELGADVNAESQRHGNALSAASYRGHKEVVGLLLEKRANIDAECRVYGNALSAASYSGHKEVVGLLLEEGANINTDGEEKSNALSAASYSGQKEVVQLLLEDGADVNAQSGSALRAAMEKCQEPVIRLLLENQADIHLVFHKDGEVLQRISVDDQEAVTKLLLRTAYLASKKIKTKASWNRTRWALYEKERESLEALYRAKDKKGT